MHKYHDSAEHSRRLGCNECRCQSGGRTYASHELVHQGVILDPRNLALPLTSDAIGHGPPRTNMFIYAVNETYDFRLAADGGSPRSQAPPDAVKHETLFQNADVRAAGEIMVVKGVIVEINSQSGSYDTKDALQNDPEFASDVLIALSQGNIPASPIVLAMLLDQRENR